MTTQDTFAPGQAAEHPYGVLYQGEYETEHDGTARAVRAHARALAGAGVPVLLQSFSHTVVSAEGVAEPVTAVGLSPQVVVETLHPSRDKIMRRAALLALRGGEIPAWITERGASLRMTDIGETAVVIKHMVVRDADQLQASILPRGVLAGDPAVLLRLRDAVYRATILFSVWERDRVDAKVARHLQRVGECWVPCEQNRTALIESGVPAAQVHVVPHPYDPDTPLLKLRQRKPQTKKKFYSIGRWEPRKGYHELLTAFVRAFRPGEAALTIKTSAGTWPDYAGPEEVLAQLARRHAGVWSRAELARDVRVIREVLRDDEMLKLHFEHTVYVAASHGEAWCLPAFDAKLAGNALVHVPWGGTADFAADTDMSVPYQLAPTVPPSYRWEPGARWADYEVDALAAALQAVALVPFELAPALARFTSAAVGEQMRARVLAAAERGHPAAHAYLSQCGTRA